MVLRHCDNSEIVSPFKGSEPCLEGVRYQDIMKLRKETIWGFHGSVLYKELLEPGALI